MSGFNPAPESGSQPNYTYTFYGITGQRLATLNCNGSNYPAYPNCTITGQNVYYGKKLIVSGGVAVVTDRLGTVRADTQSESFAYYPYGQWGQSEATPAKTNFPRRGRVSPVRISAPVAYLFFDASKRQVRCVEPGPAYHVMQRGTNRERVSFTISERPPGQTTPAKSLVVA